MTTFPLPDLPYGYDALQPTISKEIMTLHHDKHHATYVTNVNKFLTDKGASATDMESLVKSSKDTDQPMFNNAGQAWNHGFFWNVMAPNGGRPSGKLAEAIETYGGLAKLRDKFVADGVGQFKTANGDTALLKEGVPVLGCDVWEHAYYLDYKQDRKGYLEAWFDKVVNWEFAGKQYDAAAGSGEAYKYPAPTA